MAVALWRPPGAGRRARQRRPPHGRRARCARCGGVGRGRPGRTATCPGATRSGSPPSWPSSCLGRHRRVACPSPRRPSAARTDRARAVAGGRHRRHVARGQVVDEDALIDALRSRHLLGAPSTERRRAAAGDSALWTSTRPALPNSASTPSRPRTPRWSTCSSTTSTASWVAPRCATGITPNRLLRSRAGSLDPAGSWRAPAPPGHRGAWVRRRRSCGSAETLTGSAIDHLAHCRQTTTADRRPRPVVPASGGDPVSQGKVNVAVVAQALGGARPHPGLAARRARGGHGRGRHRPGCGGRAADTLPSGPLPITRGLADPDIDVVDVATGNHAHFEGPWRPRRGQARAVREAVHSDFRQTRRAADWRPRRGCGPSSGFTSDTPRPSSTPST